MRFGAQARIGTSLWSGGYGGPQEFCELGECRVLSQMPDGSNGPSDTRVLRDLICIFLESLGVIRDVAIEVGEAFDVTTAVGEQLDFIGSVVGLPRQGFSDDRYRTFLQIQIELLLSATRDEAEWTGTVPNILRICRTFIGAAVVDPVVYRGIPPYSYDLTVPGVTLVEIPQLIRFVCQATYAGVLGQIVIQLGANGVWDSDPANVGPIANGGVWDSDPANVGPLVGASVWGQSFLIGTQNC